MKKWLKITTIVASLALVGGGLTAFSFGVYKNIVYDKSDKTPNNQSIINDNQLGNNELKFENYFEKRIPFGEQKKIKLKIKKIIDDYRLKEWNEYFANPKNKNNTIKSSVLNLKWNSYSKIDDKTQINEFFKKKGVSVEWTKIYKEQDEQFRYFNDFINIINEENSKNEEDFLYLRWLFYSIDAANKYKNLTANGVNIKDINATNWATAIAEAAVGEIDGLKNLILAFLKYYGIPDKFFKNFKKYNALIKQKNYSEIDIDSFFDSMIENSIVRLLLVSKDLIMRFSSKPECDAKKNNLWKRKANRAIDMYKIAKEKYGLLIDSFTIGKDNISSIKPPNGADENFDIQKSFDSLKEYAEKILDIIATFSNVRLFHYYDIKKL